MEDKKGLYQTKLASSSSKVSELNDSLTLILNQLTALETKRNRILVELKYYKDRVSKYTKILEGM